jgi:hypothetical protein
VLVHFRLTVPDDLSDAVRDLLVDHECTTNVTLDQGAVLRPGDLIEAWPTGAPFRAAQELDASAPGHPDDASDVVDRHHGQPT